LIFKAGQRDLPLTVILNGEIEVFEKREETEQILGTPGERDFIGDVAMLQGTSALASARVKSDEAEILHVPALELRRALAELPGVSEPLVNAFIMRRQRLMRDRELRPASLPDAIAGRASAARFPYQTMFRIADRIESTAEALAGRFNLTTRDLPARLRRPARRANLRCGRSPNAGPCGR
jgi:thioredoxin reductase (NADPH)